LRAETVGLARDKNEAEDRRRELAGRADFSRDELARIDENLQELNQKVMRARANHREKSLLVNTLTGRLEALRQDDIRTSDWLKETESSVTAINRDLHEAGAEEERDCWPGKKKLPNRWRVLPIPYLRPKMSCRISTRRRTSYALMKMKKRTNCGAKGV